MYCKLHFILRIHMRTRTMHGRTRGRSGLALGLQHLAAALVTWVQILHEPDQFPVYSGTHFSIRGEAGDYPTFGVR